MELEMEYTYKENPKTHWIRKPLRIKWLKWTGDWIKDHNMWKLHEFSSIQSDRIILNWFMHVICECLWVCDVRCAVCICALCIRYRMYSFCSLSSVGNWMSNVHCALCTRYECDVMPNPFDAKRDSNVMTNSIKSVEQNHKGGANGHGSEKIKSNQLNQ